MVLFKKLQILLNTDKKGFSILLVGIVLASIVETFGIVSIAPFVALVSSPEIIGQNQYLSYIFHFFSFSSEQEFIFFTGFSLFFILIFSNFTQAFLLWRITYFSQSKVAFFSNRLFEYYLGRDYEFFLRRNTSELAKNTIEEISRVVGGVLLEVLQLISKSILSLLIMIVIFFANPLITLIIIITFSLSYVVIYKFLKSKISHYGNQTTQANTSIYKSSYEAFSGIKDVKLYAVEDFFLEKFKKYTYIKALNSSKHTLTASLPKYLIELLAFGGLVLSILYILTLDVGINSFIPSITLFVIAGYRILPSFQQIYSSFTNLRYYLPALELLFDDLQKCFENSSNYKSEKKMSFSKGIELHNLSYIFPGSKEPLFEDINFKFEPNLTYAFIGKTGSGKTTLIDLICGLLSSYSGRIIIDGKVLNSKNLNSWRNQFGYVPQSINLLDDSILKNIAFGEKDSNIELERVIKAAKLANLYSFINNLPKKFETKVGDKGVRLSGGQRQRIGIARALYKNPRILIFDEATSALDNETENEIIKAIDSLKGDRTIFIIAHRMSTIKNADKIFELVNGKIVEITNKESLN